MGKGKGQGEKGRGRKRRGLEAFVATVVTDPGRRKKSGKEGRERAKERMGGRRLTEGGRCVEVRRSGRSDADHLD